MDKTEQQRIINDVTEQLKESGTTLKWFLEKASISRTHWHFLKKGERVLSDKKKDAIVSVLKSKLLYTTD